MAVWGACVKLYNVSLVKREGERVRRGGAAVPCVLSAATLCCTQSECRRGNGSWKLEPEGVRCGGVAGKVEGCTL